MRPCGQQLKLDCEMDQAHQQIYNRMTGKKEKRIEMLQWPSQRTDHNCLKCCDGTFRSVHKQMPPNRSNILKKSGKKLLHNKNRD